MMNKHTLLIATVLSAAALSPTLGGAADTIVLGTEGAYAPFNGVDRQGRVFGFDVDIGNALCAAMKADCTWVTQEWDGMIPALLAKKYDAIVASMTINYERRRKIDFTDKYYSSPISFVRTQGSGIAVDDASIKGKRIGVQSGTVAENFVRGTYGDAVEVKAYGTQDEANLDLRSGRVDLIAADTFVVLDFVNDPDNRAEFVGPQFTDPQYVGDGIGIGVRKEDTALRDRLNRAIAQIRADGTYQRINAKYFPFDIFGD